MQFYTQMGEIVSHSGLNFNVQKGCTRTLQKNTMDINFVTKYTTTTAPYHNSSFLQQDRGSTHKVISDCLEAYASEVKQ